jgi:hypothetical protein
MKSLDLSKNFLGPLDANDDENLLDYFIKFGNFKSLINKDKFIIVGPKGTGKTAIRKFIKEKRNEENKYFIDINDYCRFPFNQLQAKSPAEIKYKMKGYLTSLIINTLSNSDDLKPEDKKKLEKYKSDIPFLKKILKPLKFKAVIVEYAVKELFPEDKEGALAKLLDKNISNAILGVLGETDIWICIDDIDSILKSKDKKASLKFVEGLVYSCSDLNISTFKKKVWIVLLLRSEIYEELLRIAVEFDKEMIYIWEISWESKELLRDFLAKRIKWALGLKEGMSIWNYWTYLFNVKLKKETIDLSNYLIERIINGPRDLLLLVYLSGNVAYKNDAQKISIEHITESEFEYGKIKLKQITSNFQRIYNDVDLVIERLFRKSKQIYKRDELEKFINKNLLTNPKARKDFENMKWIFKRSAFPFIDILYRIGFIGFWDQSKKDYIYVLECSNPGMAFTNSSKFKIHSAFLKCLEIIPPKSRQKTR